VEEAMEIQKKISSLECLFFGAKLNPVSKADKKYSNCIPNSPMLIIKTLSLIISGWKKRRKFKSKSLHWNFYFSEPS
jgi:hypothetical protein